MLKGMLKRALGVVAAAAMAVTGAVTLSGTANAVEPAKVTGSVTYTFEASEPEQFEGRDSLTAYKLADYVEYTDGTNTVYGVRTADTDGDNQSDAVLMGLIRQALTYAGVVGVPATGDSMAWAAEEGVLDSDQSVSGDFAAGTTRKFADELVNLINTYNATNETDLASQEASLTGDGTTRTVTLEPGVYLFVDENGANGSWSASKAMIVYSGTISENEDGDKYLSDPSTAPTINLKNQNTPVTKTVSPSTVPGIGDIRTYTITGEVPDWRGKNLEESYYKFVDTPGKGVTVKFDDQFKITVNGSELPRKDYAVYINDNDTPVDFDAEIAATMLGGNNSFTVVLTDYMKNAAVNEKLIGVGVVLTYQVTVNSDAIATDVDKISNKVQVNNSGSVADASVDLPKPVSIAFKKTEADGVTGLAGAEFSITRVENVGDSEQPVKVSGSNGSYVVDPNGTATVTSGTEGKVTVNGLGKGTYTVTETHAPEGFMDEFTPSFTVTVSSDNKTVTVVYDDPEDAWSLITPGNGETITTVKNVRNITQLPLTGAAGTMLFTVLGLLIAAAGVTVYMKSRSVRKAMRA